MGFGVGGIELIHKVDGIRCRVDGCHAPEMSAEHHLCFHHFRAAQKLLSNISLSDAKKAAKNGLHFVYFVQHGNDGPVKIGYTTRDPERRFNSLQTGSPVELRLLAYLACEWWLERSLHMALAAHNIRGEWFENCPEIKMLVALALDGQRDLIHEFAKKEGGIKYKKKRSNRQARNARIRSNYFDNSLA